MGEDEPEMVYVQDGVLIKKASEKYKNYEDLVGSLSIHKHISGKITMDWKPNSFGIQDNLGLQEWIFVVQNIEESNSESRSLPNIVIDLENLDLLTNSKYITIKLNDNADELRFYFANDNADTFIRHISMHCKTGTGKRNTLKVLGPISLVKQSNSLSDIDKDFYDYQSYTWGAVGNIVKNLKEKPIETAWNVGTKALGVIFGHEEATHQVATFVNKDGEAVAKISDEYEIIQKQQRPPKLPDTTRGIPLSATQWNSYKNAFGQIECVNEVKQIIFRGGVDESIRPEVWKYLLNYFPWNMKTEEYHELIKLKKQEYFTLKQQWKSISPGQESRFTDYHERKNLVEKDVNRTDRAHIFYAGENNENLNTLFNILMTYVMYDFDLGYVQGMSDLLSPLYMLMNDEVDAFWCFVGFMDKVHSNFDIEQAGMKHQFQQLSQLMMFTDPELCKYLHEHDSSNMYFCFRWLLVLFKREFSFGDIMRLWEVLWTGLPCENFHLLIALAILQNERDSIINKNYEFSNILKHINDLSMNLTLMYIISKAEQIYYIIAARNPPNFIREILGMEEAQRSDSSEKLSPEGTSSDHSKNDMCESTEYASADACDQSINLNFL